METADLSPVSRSQGADDQTADVDREEPRALEGGGNGEGEPGHTHGEERVEAGRPQSDREQLAPQPATDHTDDETTEELAGTEQEPLTGRRLGSGDLDEADREEDGERVVDA